LKAHSVMDSRSAEFPPLGTQALGVSKVERLPWDEEPLLLLPKVDYLNRRVNNPFGGGRSSFGAPFLLYPLQNTHQVEAESKKLIDLHKAPLEPEKEKTDLEQSTTEPPQTLEDRKNLIESQSKVALLLFLLLLNLFLSVQIKNQSLIKAKVLLSVKNKVRTLFLLHHLQEKRKIACSSNHG
jgi:hypothetical protein